MFLLIGMTGNLWLFYFFAALFGIAFGGISTIVSALAGDVFGEHNLGKIMGWIGIAWFTGAAIGSFIGGIIHDIYGSYFLAFLIGAVCMVTLIPLLALVTKPSTENHLNIVK
jgi:MFS family permease